MARHALTVLPGGERVVTERLPGVRSVALGIWIAVGSRDEPSERAGVSHFIEHLLFKGSDRYSAREIAERFDEMGGELNAATSRETTVVYTRVPDWHLDSALDMLLEMVFAPALRDVDSEREVVLEEIAMVEDNPQDLVHDVAADVVFGGHPLGRPVIGDAAVIARVTPRALRSYHRGAYVGANVVVSAAGNVQHDALVEQIAARLPAVPSPSKVRRRALRALPPPGLRVLRRPTEQYHVVLAAPGIARNDPRRFAGTLLDTILGGSSSSRLFQEVREKRGMAYSVYSYASQYEETGQIGVYVGTREENLEACMDVIAQELAAIGAGAVDPAELERAKENIEGRILLAQESTSNRMTRLGRSFSMDLELLTLRQTLRRIDAVTVDEVVALASELLAPERISAAAVGPRTSRLRSALARVAPQAVPR